MSQFFYLYPDNPQPRVVKQVAALLRAGKIAAIPTDSCYALVCALDQPSAVDKIRQIRQIDEKHHLTLLCRDLSEISTYARVDNAQYRLLKASTPGAYTFILEASKEVPRRASHPSRKTIGIRVPENVITLALLSELNEALLSTTLILPGHAEALNDPEIIRAELGKRIDVIIDGGYCGSEPTSVVDLISVPPVVLRRGKGSLQTLGISEDE